MIPVFEYFIKDGKLTFRWIDCVRGFNMPLRLYISGIRKDIVPTARFSTIDLETDNAIISVDPNYYVGF